MAHSNPLAYGAAFLVLREFVPPSACGIGEISFAVTGKSDAVLGWDTLEVYDAKTKVGVQWALKDFMEKIILTIASSVLIILEELFRTTKGGK